MKINRGKYYISFWWVKFHLLFAWYHYYKGFYYIHLPKPKDDYRRVWLGKIEIEWRITK